MGNGRRRLTPRQVHHAYELHSIDGKRGGADAMDWSSGRRVSGNSGGGLGLACQRCVPLVLVRPQVFRRNLVSYDSSSVMDVLGHCQACWA